MDKLMRPEICPKCGAMMLPHQKKCFNCLGSFLYRPSHELIQPSISLPEPISLPNIIPAFRPIIVGQADGQDIELSYDKRTQGIAVIGKNGMGKSTLIHTIINQELQGSDCTILLFDPHNALARDILSAPTKKPLRFVSPETTTPFGLNLFEVDSSDYLAVERTVNVAIEIFKKLIGKDATYMPRFEYIMGSVARTIIYADAGYTLAEVPLFLTDLQFSKNAAQRLTNPELKRFWQDYETSFWDKTGKVARPYDRFLYLESVANRVSTLLQNELFYRIVSHSHSTLRFSDLIESGDCLLFSLPMGQLGEGVSSLLGSILLAKFAEAIYQRGIGKKRVHLYIDEYGRYFATPFTADLLTQGRKYNASTLVTMQTLQTLPDEQNTAAVLNAGNLFCFQLIGKDAEILAKQFPLPGPLPEPINPLTPYTISPTPVEDIWKKGHPAPAVMNLRNSLFILLHRIETEPYEKVFQCPALRSEEGKELQKIFTDMEDYCSSREQITEGFNKLNELLVMTEKGNVDIAEWEASWFTVLLLFRGYMGIYPQNHKDTEGEYTEWLQARAKRGLVDPRQLEKGFEWVPIKMAGWLAEELFDLFIGIRANDEKTQAAIRVYGPDRGQAMLHALPTRNRLFRTEYHNRSDEEWLYICARRVGFEINNMNDWNLLLVQAIQALRDSAVMTQASTYTGGRTWERSQADMRDELVMRLASLPTYTAICQLLYNDGSTQSHIVRIAKE